MKNFLTIGILGLLILGFGIYARNTEIEGYQQTGTVLKLGAEQALLSRRTDLTEADLQKSYLEWLSGDYDLIYLEPLPDAEVQPGTLIRFVLRAPETHSYPSRAFLESYEILD